MEFHHVSVLLQEAVDLLEIDPTGLYVDATLGAGGHSKAIAQKLTSGHLYSFDQDPQAILAASQVLEPYRQKVTLIQSNFEDIKAQLALRGVFEVHGITADFGVSSPQLDQAERGFSYHQEAPLDMRMDPSSKQSAYEIVNGASKEELSRILRVYGEEKWAARIAAIIEERRAQAPLLTTSDLVEAVKAAIPKNMREKDQHPARRTFQAVRIAVNRELEVIERLLEDGAELLLPGAVMAVISFHSLEDRIVKEAFKTLATGCTCPPQFPVCVCHKQPRLKILTRKPILASPAEIQRNPRARSAKMRAIRKLGEK